MTKTFLAALALTAIVGATAARADEFGGQNAGQAQGQGNVSAYMDQQATDSQLSDPTAPNSIRSHGRP